MTTDGTSWGLVFHHFMLRLLMSWMVSSTTYYSLPYLPSLHQPVLKKVRKNCIQSHSYFQLSLSWEVFGDLICLWPTLNPAMASVFPLLRLHGRGLKWAFQLSKRDLCLPMLSLTLAVRTTVTPRSFLPVPLHSLYLLVFCLHCGCLPLLKLVNCDCRLK